MIAMPFDPDTLGPAARARWDAWIAESERACEAVRRARADDETIDLRRREVWAELKEWMFLNVFEGKCAYCEWFVRGGAYGDAEHWRPKAAVTERGDEPVLDREGNPHPGYYWLAYDWRNLLPACQECNNGTRLSRGKGTRFPIAGRRIFSPDEVDDLEQLNEVEQPLLLHPFFDVPEEHIDFDDQGQPIARHGSRRGEASIEVFNLEREWLNRKRSALHLDMRLKVKQAMAAQLLGGPQAVDQLRPLMDPRREFAAAIGSYIRKWYLQVPNEEFIAQL